jgi:hypothetical protein
LEEVHVTLLQDNRGKYRAFITNIHLGGKSIGWDVARRARELVRKSRSFT